MKAALITALLLVAALPLSAQRDSTSSDLVAPVLAISSAMLAADIVSTIYLRQTCRYCQETNPLARPFVHAGPVATVAFGVAIGAGSAWASNKLRHTKVGRHVWWLVPLALTAASSYGTVSNLHWIRWWHSTP